MQKSSSPTEGFWEVSPQSTVLWSDDMIKLWGSLNLSFSCGEVTCKVVSEKMTDWGPVFVAVTLFIVLSPGLLFQIPAKSRFVEFGNHQTSGPSILVHSIIYFALICISLMAIRVKIHLGLG
ncbi:hypothetical protein V6N13_111760 [Hibiscus sabdariffa]|uniref:Uncharacterized protein n=2 Tax=Hibiscus sabdariffa TaxID=183260 RepID=A0ABR1Z702_9ROSI